MTPEGAQAIVHIEAAMEALSLQYEVLGTRKPTEKLVMCIAEECDRLNAALPSETFRHLADRIRTAWTELRLAHEELMK